MKLLSFACLAALGCAGELTGSPAPDASTTPDAPPTDAPPGGAGMLQISATSSTGGGQYAPRNVVAIWIEGPGGFVKTVGRWANQRKQHLVAWTMGAGAADADAVSGATRQNHATALAATWNLQNRQGQVVADGTYTVRMESTELNANTAAQNHQGTFTFVKSGTAQTQTALSNGGFSNVSITFTP
jgi:Predicted periplasmic protein (DUF2271)